jgi:orotidine-5'-phosphate decarboxylase
VVGATIDVADYGIALSDLVGVPVLAPGFGAQGGDLELVSKYGMNKQCGLLVNSARAIIYASGGTDFAAKAAAEARKVSDEMKRYLELYL